MKKYLLLFFSFVFIVIHSKAQQVLIGGEYQCLRNPYYAFSVGYESRNQRGLHHIARYGTVGFEAKYYFKPGTSDWGTALGYSIYSGSYRTPVGGGLDLFYRSINDKKYFGLKPKFGLTYQCLILLYGYNWNFSQNKSDLVRHEIIAGFRIGLRKK